MVAARPQPTGRLSRRFTRAAAWAGHGRGARVGPEHAALLAILALSTVLNVHRLSQNGFANTYYSAAIKSMLGSLHRFLYVSADPGGLITVDKPPLGLWLQAASAKLFGFVPLSLLLPEAIAGVLSVLALYLIVARRAGPLAGLLSALALSVFPSFVAVSRDNNLDALLILLMVLACGAGLRATENGRLRHLLACALLIGLAFNTKALAAVLVLPGLALAYLVCAPVALPRRLLSLLAAALVMVAISAAWLMFVDATPKSQRPYVGGSVDNSEFGLTFGYNGFGRVGGQVGGPGDIPGLHPPPAARAPRASSPAALHGHHRAHQPVSFGGPTGPLRLFGKGLGDQGGWVLPFALLGAIAAALTLRRRRDPATAATIVFGSWFVVEAAVLSLSKGIVHPYYVSALGPGCAAMCGLGVAALASLATRSRLWLALAAVALGATIAAQDTMLAREDYLRWDVPVAIAVALAALALVLIRRTLARPALALGLTALLIAPAAYARTTWEAPVQGTFPAAGPYQAAGPGGVGVAGKSLKIDRALIAYVGAHGSGSRWALLTQASTTAAPLILMGMRAGAIGGYSASDPAVSVRGLAGFVRRREARYVLLGGPFASRGGNAASTAVRRSCVEVSLQDWYTLPLGADGRPFVPRQTLATLALYDCAGRARAILAGRPAPTRRRSRRHARRSRRQHRPATTTGRAAGR